MKIGLIIPPSPFLIDEKVYVNLGILKVASVLETYKHSIKIIDLSGKTNCNEEVINYLEGLDVVGFTCTTPQFPYVVKLSKIIRLKMPIIKQVIGGSHPSLIHTSFKREQKLGIINGRASKNWNCIVDIFDSVVCGDGEFAILEVLNNIYNQDKLIIDGDIIDSHLFLSSRQFNESKFPARHLINLDEYHSYINGKRATSIISQLGCPFSCGFCSGRNSPMFRKIRLRTTESVIDEILNIYDNYGYEAIMMYDDELNVNPSMNSLMRQLILIRNKIDFFYRGCIKSELFTEEQAKLMSDAGFKEILIGFESGNERILKNINKKATKSDNERSIEYARKYGIKVKFLMSIGHPGESDETCQDTLDWLLKMKPEEFNVTIITCIPGSFYYDFAIKTDKDYTYTALNGDRLHSYDIDYSTISDYYNGSIGNYKSYVYTDFLKSSDLIWWRDYIEKTVRSKYNMLYPQISQCYDKTMGQ